MIRPAVALTLTNERGQPIPFADDWTARQDSARRVSIRRETAGKWRVAVNWKWYAPVTLRGVRVQKDACGPVKPTSLTVRLKPLPDAPKVREFSLLYASPEGLFVAYWPHYQRMKVFLDAPGVSPEVIWTSGDPNVATIDQSAMLHSVCSRTPAWTTITATLGADPRVQATTRFGRGGGGMNCKRGAVDR